jgi:hypothetical protein
MKEIIIEIEVDEPSQIMELPVNGDNVIELDFTYLDDELDDMDFDGDAAVVTNPATDQNPDHDDEGEAENEDFDDMESDDFDDELNDEIDL